MSHLRLYVEGTALEFEGLFFQTKTRNGNGKSVVTCFWQVCTVYMEFFECELLSTLSPAPSLWLRYVDDVLLIWPIGQDFVSFVFNVNTLSISIKLTVERNYEGKSHISDTLAHRLLSGFSVAVYRKPTHSGTYLHHFS